jgi:hypothetical protein
MVCSTNSIRFSKVGSILNMTYEVVVDARV